MDNIFGMPSPYSTFSTCNTQSVYTRILRQDCVGDTMKVPIIPTTKESETTMARTTESQKPKVSPTDLSGTIFIVPSIPPVKFNPLKQRLRKLSESGLGNKSLIQKFTGIFLALLAGIFYTLSVLIVKFLSNHHPLSLSVWRYTAFIIAGIFMCFYSSVVRQENILRFLWPIFGDSKQINRNRKMLFTFLISAIFTGSALILRFYALNFMSLADATALAFSGPVVAVISGHFFLNEKCGIVTLPIALWTVVGVFIIIRPPILTGESEFSRETLIGTGISMASVFIGTFYYIMMRKLRKMSQYHISIISVIALGNGVVGLIESVVFAIGCEVFTWPEGTQEIILTTIMGFLSFLSNFFIVLALKYEMAGTVSLVRTTDVLFAFCWQIIFLNLIPDTYSYLGASIIVSGVVLISIRSCISQLSEESMMRKIFKILLR